MAKELPYFKFEPNQWENGNIQMLSREDKGLFIDLCSMYWSRLGDLPKKLAIQKLCAGNATALDSLCDEQIIEVIDGNIYIKFLSEQLDEFDDLSKQNSENAKIGWIKRREKKQLSERNATALNSQCENDAIREDKIKENKEIDIDFDKLLESYNTLTGKSTRKVTDKAKRQIKARYKDGYTKTDIWNAMLNCSKDKFHKENNYKYFTLEFITREDKLNNFLSLTDREHKHDPDAQENRKQDWL
jgi:hypothetical protein